tara:strand:+ start:678 stop:785 length:108 start_codon:yes stop_codon:yes gene_type:complete
MGRVASNKKDFLSIVDADPLLGIFWLSDFRIAKIV